MTYWPRPPHRFRFAPSAPLRLPVDALDTLPISLRLTFAEQAPPQLTAAHAPLRRRRRHRQSVRDEQALIQLLTALGETKLAHSLHQLATAARTGSLLVTPETERALRAASIEVQWMRRLLLQALGCDGGGP